MTKRVLSIVSFLVSLTSLFAAPVGNPSFPQLIQEGLFIPCDSWIDLRLGYEGDFIGDARMNQYAGGSGRVDNYAMNTNSATVTLNFVDRLDVYAVFGSSRTCADWRFSQPEVVNRMQIGTKYRFLWAVGSRAILYEWGCTILGLGGRYSKTTSPISWGTINGTPTPARGARLEWREWQVDLDLAHKIDLFIPYVGIKYSNAKAKVEGFSVPIANHGTTGTLEMKNRSPIGLIVGCTLTTGKYFMLNVEGRLIDEEALTISGDFRF